MDHSRCDGRDHPAVGRWSERGTVGSNRRQDMTGVKNTSSLYTQPLHMTGRTIYPTPSRDSLYHIPDPFT